MLVVADEGAVGIGGQRGLAGAGQAEEQRDVAVLADIGRAVHRHHALRRQIEVERGEHRLLHLAGIGRAADQHDLAGEIDRHHRVGAFAAAMPLGVGLERRQIDDGHFGHEDRELRALRPDQELADEQRVPGIFGEHARLDAVLRIGAADRDPARTASCPCACARKSCSRVSNCCWRLLAVAVPPDHVLGECIDRRCAYPWASGRCGGRSRRRAGPLCTMAASPDAIACS